MTQNIISFLIIIYLLCLSGCDDEAAEDTNSPVDKPNGACEDLAATTDDDGNRLYVITADAAQNYAFESTLAAETIPVRSSTNLHFDWSDVTTDMLGRDFDPLSSVDMMEVLLWQYNKDDLLQDINDDNLDRGKLQAIAYIETGNEVSAGDYLDVLSPGGSQQPQEVLMEYLDTELFPTDEFAYLFMVAEGTVFGQGTKMLVFFEPDPEESDTEIRLSDDSTTLDYSVDMSDLTPVSVPSGEPNIVFDWIDEDGALGTNAMGSEWSPNRITDVKIAHYESMTLEELEENFLDMELIADEMWTVFLSAGQSVNLGTLTNEDKDPFPGIDDTGTWVLTLNCGSCTHPAPWFLTVLEPCDK